MQKHSRIRSNTVEPHSYSVESNQILQNLTVIRGKFLIKSLESSVQQTGKTKTSIWRLRTCVHTRVCGGGWSWGRRPSNASQCHLESGVRPHAGAGAGDSRGVENLEGRESRRGGGGSRRRGRGGLAPGGNHELGETSCFRSEAATRTGHGDAAEIHGCHHGRSAPPVGIFWMPPRLSCHGRHYPGRRRAAADTQDGGLKYKYDKQIRTEGLLQYYPGAKIQNNNDGRTTY
jgi:hypothetical protein